MHLTGFLSRLGYKVFQRDLSIKVVRDILLSYGGDEAEEILELLSGNAPDEAKIAPSEFIDELAIWIRDNVDKSFGFSRYAERISASAKDFGAVEKLIKKRGVLDEPLEFHLEDAIKETRPTIIGVSCPFPGTLVAAFKIAAYVKKHYPKVKMFLGGGFVSTELRDLKDERPFKYFDEFMYDEGYDKFVKGVEVPLFVAPSYEGIDWDEYFDVVETINPMHRLWSVGRWRKLIMARGCYWHKCAFCDVSLPYIKCFTMTDPKEIVDAMEKVGGGIHFVDEAMPPAVIRGVCKEILRRGYKTEWWGNVRFDKSFTPELCQLMADAGCIAVTAGLECANDRLLKLMNKGITLESSRAAMKAFHDAGIMVHAYLMYGFPTETEKEAFGALDFVRGLIKEDLIQSAFWHRFALTVHSPIAKGAEKFGLKVLPHRGKFCKNELAFIEEGAPDWDLIGKALNLAMMNYLEGRGLNKSMKFWKNAAENA